MVETYAYGPFGETAGASALGNPLRYTGRAYDAATGLYDNRLRNYHPVLGRFIEPDPIGPAGGINLYAYVNSDPINFIDPLGLSAMDNGGAGYGSGQGASRLDSGSFIYGLTASANAVASGIGAREESVSLGRVLGNDTGFTGQRDILIRTSLSEPVPVFGQPAAGGLDFGVDAAVFAFVGTPRELTNSIVSDASLFLLELKVFHLQGGGSFSGIRGVSIGWGLGLGASSIDGSAVPTTVRITDVANPFGGP